ncbi:nucleoside-diphosphate-sugar epimerase [Ilyonectria destructans]|nr:nucleoside-diphosphate-sugar epimerase [Ilyonectria destructans]
MTNSTGATGYVGGTVFHTLVTDHPEYETTVLLRNVPPGFSDKYPKVTVIRGTFDNTDLLTRAASEADIVIHHGNSDHIPAVSALLAGVVERANASLPASYIHLGGTGIIADTSTPGEIISKIGSDIDDIDAIWSLPLARFHRPTELLIQKAWTQHGGRLKTAVVCPPHIHGKGTGPSNTSSFYVPAFYQETVKAGAPFYVNSGSNVYSRVHVEDVGQVFLKLIEAAAAGGDGADWNHDGYYFVPSEEVSQLKIARVTGNILQAQGLISTNEPQHITLDELEKKLPGIPVPGVQQVLFAANSRTKANRAQKVLGVRPKSEGFLDSLEGNLLRAAGLKQ